PAEWVAYGAVSALHACGAVDSLCFGSEAGNIDWMLPLAQALADESGPFQQELKKQLKQGQSYPSAYHAAIEQVFNQSQHEHRKQLTQPNNTLGLHYLISLQRLDSPIQPYTIPRKAAGYHDQDLGHESIA